MGFPAAPTESGSAKIHFLTTTGNAAAGWAAIDTATSDTGSNVLGFAAIATHVEGDAVGAPGGIDTTSVPLVLVGGDDGTNAVPLQLSGTDLKITLDSETVVLGAGTAAFGKLSANSGVDIGDVDVTSISAGDNNIGNVDIVTLPSGNLGQQAMSASLSVVPASNVADATYIGDIKFGEALPTGANTIGSVTGTGTFVVQENGAALTALQLIDDAVYVDDADWTNNTSKHLLVGGVYESSPQTITDGDVGPLEVDANGYLKVSLEANPVGVAGSTAYTEDVVSANPIVGTATVIERDDQLGTVTPVEGDWLGLRGTSKGALWVALADASGDPLTSFGGGTEYTEDVASANPIVGKAIVIERDDVLSTGVAEGDWLGLKSSAEGALWTQDFNSDAILAVLGTMDADTGSIKTAVELLDNAIDGSYLNANMNLAGTDITGGAGAVTAQTQRVVLATDDPAVALLTTIDSDTNDILVDTANMDTNITAILADTANIDTNITAILADTAAMDANLATIDADTGAIKTAVELIDNAIAGSEMQVDVVAALPAGTNAIGKLAANSGVDIGDVTINGPLGAGVEAGALLVTLATDSTGVVSIDDNGGDISIDDGGNTITIDGNIGDDGPGFTPVYKYLAKATTADATLWDPTNNYLYVTDVIISISGTATDVTLGFGAGTDLEETFLKFHGDVRGGLTHHFRAPIKSTDSGDNLNIALSAAQAMTITICGYETTA